MVANVISENLAASKTTTSASRKTSSVINFRDSYLLLQPNTINFSCHEIPELFLDNLHVHFWITRLTTNPKIINTLPVMTVFQVEGGCIDDDKWYTYNNSLLYVYRVLNFRGIINEIQVGALEYLVSQLYLLVPKKHLKVYIRTLVAYFGKL